MELTLTTLIILAVAIYLAWKPLKRLCGLADTTIVHLADMTQKRLDRSENDANIEEIVEANKQQERIAKLLAGGAYNSKSIKALLEIAQPSEDDIKAMVTKYKTPAK